MEILDDLEPLKGDRFIMVNSSPASATKEPSKSKDLDGFSYAFRTLQMGLLTRFEHMCFGVANWL